MKRFKSIALVALVAVLAIVGVLPNQPVSAQSSASLSIVPKKNYVVEQGKSVKDTLTIRNLDDEKQLDLTLRIVDFTFEDDSGTPKLFLDPEAPQTTWSIKPFVTIPTSVSIPPKGSKTIDMRVAIPATQGAGSYYSAILYSSGQPDGGNVGLNASGVTLAFVSVPGDVNEDLKLEKFGAYNIAKEKQKAGYISFTADEPLNMAYQLKNNGNVTESPVGTITIKDIFGREIVIDNINPNSSLALMGQSRTFTACIKLQKEKVDFAGSRAESTNCTSPGLWPGLYTASIDIFYGQNGNRTQEVTGTGWFWYLPWWFVIAVVIILLIAAYFIWRLVRVIRRKLYGPQMGRRKSYRRR